MAAGKDPTFEQYMRAYELCYEMPLDELELHLSALVALQLKSEDEFKAEHPNS